MLFYIVLVLGVWKGVIGNDDSCDVPSDLLCELSDDFTYPYTEEDFIKQCPIVREWHDCLEDYANKCGYDEDVTEEILERVRDMVNKFCSYLPTPSGEIGNDDVCDMPVDQVCTLTPKLETEDDYVYQCTTARRWNYCREDYANECGYDDELTEEGIERVREFYDDLCDSSPSPLGVMGNDDLCDTPVDQVCTLPHDLGYPETEEDKIYQCPLVRQWNDCRKDYVKKCGYVDGLTEARIQRVTDLYDDLCDSLPRPLAAIAIDDGVCQERADRACPSHRIWPDTFPANIEELRNGCQKVHIVTQCINDTLRECKSDHVAMDENYYSYNYELDENPQRLTFDQRLMYIATQVCDEDSEFHRNNIRYLPCLKSAFETHVRTDLCWDYSEKALDFLSNRIEGKARMAGGSEDRAREVRHEIWKCLRVAFDLNCVIMELSKACDSGVKQPILEVVEKLEIIDDQCPMSTRMDVIEILDALKLVSPQEIHVEGLIRVNSFF